MRKLPRLSPVPPRRRPHGRRHGRPRHGQCHRLQPAPSPRPPRSTSSARTTRTGATASRRATSPTSRATGPTAAASTGSTATSSTRDRDRQWTYVWYRYTDKFGRSHQKFFKNNSFGHGDRFNKFFGFKKGFVKDVDFRVCEGVNKFDDCGGWGDAF